ncbi:EpsG family protein [Sphingobacterium siyangense]|uniref:EpsG family protein n=1 Tax=Sphingobacterium siyangense TaxID=459529 RepID=UPI003DA4FF1B
MELIGKLFSDGMIYLIIYLWLFLLAFLETCKDTSRYKQVFAWISFVLLTLLTGLRWETGTDWEAYFNLFDTLELDWTFLMNIYAFDLGYVVFNALVRLFTHNYTIFLLIDSFLALGILFSFLRKYSPNPNISFFIFYNAFFVSQFMGSNRRMISMAAVLFLFVSVFQRRTKVYFVWQTLAFLFHRTAFMAAVTWLVPLKRFTEKKIGLLLGSALVIGVFELPYKLIGFLGSLLAVFSSAPLIEKLIFYSDPQHNLEVISENINPVVLMTLSVIKRSIFLLFYLIVIRRNNRTLDPLTDFFFNIYIVGFTLYMLMNGSPIFQMISTYFTFIEIALIGRIWVYTDTGARIIFLCILLIYGFFQLLSALNAYPELYMPYRFFFDK